jgi:hypothetical protein
MDIIRTKASVATQLDEFAAATGRTYSTECRDFGQGTQLRYFIDGVRVEPGTLAAIMNGVDVGTALAEQPSQA